MQPARPHTLRGVPTKRKAIDFSAAKRRHDASTQITTEFVSWPGPGAKKGPLLPAITLSSSMAMMGSDTAIFLVLSLHVIHLVNSNRSTAFNVHECSDRIFGQQSLVEINLVPFLPM